MGNARRQWKPRLSCRANADCTTTAAVSTAASKSTARAQSRLKRAASRDLYPVERFFSQRAHRLPRLEQAGFRADQEHMLLHHLLQLVQYIGDRERVPLGAEEALQPMLLRCFSARSGGAGRSMSRASSAARRPASMPNTIIWLKLKP